MDAVYRFALRLASAPDAAEDLVQETYFRAYRAWDQYTPGTRCKSWLFTICRNVYLRQRERSQRHDEIVAREAGEDPRAASRDAPTWVSSLGRDPEKSFFDSFVDREILEAIDGLQEEYREAVVLSDVEGLPYQEVADLLGVPVGTVKSRLFRGRRQLQQKLYEYATTMGYIPAAGGEG
jgi:RNA polymerase sigma-70 factor (ECF subfamily)